MATVNYGLPTFDGENATKPIQFKSTITQGFQKIDEVMKANETAAGAVEELSNVVTQLNEKIEAVASAINAINAQTSYRPTLTAVSDAAHFAYGRVSDILNDGVYIYYEISFNGISGGSIPKGTIMATATGDIFSLGTREYLQSFTAYVNTLADSIKKEYNGVRIRTKYVASTNTTQLILDTDLPSLESTQQWQLFPVLHLRNPITSIETPSNIPELDDGNPDVEPNEIIP